MQLNKEELIRVSSQEYKVPMSHIRPALDAVLNEIMDTVASGQEVKIHGFGVFRPKTRAAKKGRHPVTGEILDVPAKKTVVFTPGAFFDTAIKEAN